MTNNGKRYFKKPYRYANKSRWAMYDPATQTISRIFANKRHMYNMGAGNKGPIECLLYLGYTEVLPKYLQVDEGL